MESGWEVVFGFTGGSHETTNVPDEARALAIANVVMGKTGGPGSWVSLHPDADTHRLAVRTGGAGPLQSIRIRRAGNSDATPAPEPTPEPKPEPTPETRPTTTPTGDGVH